MNDLGDKFAHSPVTTLLMDGVSVRLYEDGIALKEMSEKIQEICDKGGNKRIIQKLRLFLHGVNSAVGSFSERKAMVATM